MLVQVWSRYKEQEASWKVTICLNGPLANDDAPYAPRYDRNRIKYYYIIPKKEGLTRTMIDRHTNHIEYFYAKLCDGYPEKYLNLFEYTFNIPLGTFTDARWYYSYQYWGTSEVGLVHTLRRLDRLSEIIIHTDYEELTDYDWKLSSSDSE